MKVTLTLKSGRKVEIKTDLGTTSAAAPILKECGLLDVIVKGESNVEPGELMIKLVFENKLAELLEILTDDEEFKTKVDPNEGLEILNGFFMNMRPGLKSIVQPAPKTEKMTPETNPQK